MKILESAARAAWSLIPPILVGVGSETSDFRSRNTASVYIIQRFKLDNFYLFIGPLASVVYEDPVSLRGSTDNKTKMSKELLQKIFLGK